MGSGQIYAAEGGTADLGLSARLLRHERPAIRHDEGRGSCSRFLNPVPTHVAPAAAPSLPRWKAGKSLT